MAAVYEGLKYFRWEMLQFPVLNVNKLYNFINKNIKKVDIENYIWDDHKIIVLASKNTKIYKDFLDYLNIRVTQYNCVIQGGPTKI